MSHNRKENQEVTSTSSSSKGLEAVEPKRCLLRRLLLIGAIGVGVLLCNLNLSPWVSANFATTDLNVTHKIRLHAPSGDPTSLQQLVADSFPSNSPEEQREITASAERFDGTPLSPNDTIAPNELILLGHRTLTLVPRFLEIRYTQNHGNSFGFIRSFEEERRSLNQPLSRRSKRAFLSCILIALVLLVAGVILWMTQPRKKRHLSTTSTASTVASRLINIGLGLFVGGGVANAIDRYRTGFVIDYIHLTTIDFPTFNFADTALCCGFLLVVIGAGILSFAEDNTECTTMSGES